MNMKLRKAISIFCAASLFLTGVPFRAYTEGDPAPAASPEEQEEFMPESAPELHEAEELEIEDVTIPQNVWAHYVIEIPQTPDRTTWTLTEKEEARKEHVIRITSGRDISLFFLLNTDAEAAALLSMEDNESRKKFTATDANEIPALSEETGSHYILKSVQIEAGGSRLIRIKSATPVRFTLKAMTGSAWQKLTAAPNEEETEKTEEPAQEENNGQSASEENVGTTLEVEELTETPAAEKQEETTQEPAKEENNEQPASEENTGTTLEVEELTETSAAEKQEELAQESAEEEKNDKSAETTSEENTEETAENEAPADEKQGETAEETHKSAEEKQNETAEESQEEPAQKSAEEENNEKNNEESAETASEENKEEPAETVNEENAEETAENGAPAEEKQDETAEESQEEPAQKSAEEENNEESAENEASAYEKQDETAEETRKSAEEENNEESAENEEPADDKQDETAEEARKSAEEENNEESVETASEGNNEEPAETVNEENAEETAENEESADEKQDETAEEAEKSAEEENNEESAETASDENNEEPAEPVNEENAEETAEDQEENPEEESAEEAEAEPEEEFWEEVISEHIDDYTVTVTITKEAEFPIGTIVKITPLNSTAYLNEAAGIFDKNENELGNFIRVFDITFYYEDMEIEPLVPIDVKITFDNAVQLEGENELKLIHLHEEEEAREIEAEAQTTEVEAEAAESAGDENAQTQTVTNVESLSFQSGKFSTYIVAEEVVVYTFSQSGQNYEVVLKYNAGANMPEDAVFSVEEITEDSELYEQYRAQVAAVINPEGTVRMPALLDISLKKENGEKIQLGNKVQVIVRMTGDEDLTKALKVVHFPGEDPFQGESAVRDAVAESDAHAEIEVLDIESEKLYGRVNTAENTVTFNTDSFSVFALAYTVDFYYGEFEYHMEGSGEMLLSELFAQLGIERSAADVVRAEFTDPSLLQLERTEDDWKLTSLQPFDTVESLTLNFRNGDTILLRVEDSRDAFRVVVNDSNAGTLFSDAGDLGKFTDHNFAASFGSTNEENSSPSIYHSFTANAKSGYRFAFWLAVYPDYSTEIIYSNPLPASTQTQAGGTTTFIACFAPQNKKLVIMYAKPQDISDIKSSSGVHGVALPPGQTIRFLCFYTNENYSIEASRRSGAFQGWYNGNTLISTDTVFDAEVANNLTGLENIFITPVYGVPGDSPAMIVNGVFLSKIKFFDVNSTINLQTSSSPMHITGTLAAPTLKKYYYLLAVLKDNAGHELGWAVNPVALNGNAETTTGFYSFHAFEETPGTNGRGSDTNTDTLLYTPGSTTVETRLYYSDSELSGADQRTYAYLKKNAVDHPEAGCEYGGNFMNAAGENEIHLKAAPAEKKYFVRVFFDEEAATPFADVVNDRYYVNVKVSHASTVDSFQGALLALNPSELQTDSNGNRYIEFDFTNWKNGAGTTSSGAFTGYESSILVELIHQWQNAYKPEYDKNDAAPIPEGTLVKAYRVHYDTRDTNPKNTPTGFYENRTADHVWCYDYIHLTTINATDDYSYSTILGPNMSYGIVADHLYQGNDLQTNFAVNHYSAHGHYVSPDLSGTSSGAIVIGEFNLVDGMAPNGIGAVSYDDVWGRLPVGQVLGKTLIVYADDDTGFNAPDGNVSNIDNGKSVVVVHANGADLSASMVQPGINYGINMSNALMRHPDTFTPPITSSTSATLDTTGFADGTTIYIDGDLYADILKVSGGLTIQKRENQTIIFNFDTTKDLEIRQFKVKYLKADGTYENEWTTSTDTANGTDQNKRMDFLSRHLVWNLNGVKGKTTINEAGGIFLQPNRNSEIDIAATSGGWIVSNGFVYNSSAEWHNFFIDMPDTNKLNLRAIKTVDGKIPRAGQKFDFILDEYDTTAQNNWRYIETKQNTNANVVFEQMSNLSEGWHVFRIHENTTVPTGDGIEPGLYIIDQKTYYAVAHVTKITDPADPNDFRYIITPPTYYEGLGSDGHFDSSKFTVKDGPQEGAFGDKVTAATFDNEAVKQGLTIEKKVEGTTDATKRFTFEVELKDGNGQPLTGSYNYTVTNIAGTKQLSLTNGKGTIVLRNGQKATIEGLPVETQYSITETMVGDTAVIPENKDNADGYDVPDAPVTGTIGSSDLISIARFTNVYHAAGSATIRAKKTLNNHPLAANQFKFTLTPLNSAVSTVQEAYNDADGNVTFTALNFTEADMTGALVMPNGSRVKILMYYISESDGTLENFNYGNVTYDETKILIITLTDDGKGHITAHSMPEDFTVSFVNNYELKAPGTLEGNKKLTGRDMAAGEFTFTARLYQFTDDSKTETYDVRETIEESTGKTDNNGNQIMKTVSNPAYQTSAHGVSTKLTAKNTAAAEGGSSGFTFPTVYYMDPGEYYYQITENTGLGELPMGINAVDPSKTYYAKVTVPPVAGRTESTVSTVEYFSDAACSMHIDKTAVLFENEQPTIDFTVTKSWTDQNGAAKNEGYSIVFAVKQNGRDYPVTDGHLEITAGDAAQVEILTDGTVRLTGNASDWPVVKLKKLPVATYTVTETEKTPAAGDTSTYTTTYEVAGRTAFDHATVTEDESSVTIHNSIGDDRYTSITVEKKWKTGETEYTPDSGFVTFRLTKKETRQSAVAAGKLIGVAYNSTTSSVHVGNTLLASFTVGFGSTDAKKAFYRQYNNHKLNGVGYHEDSEHFNGDLAGGRQTIYLPQPCPLTSEQIEAINDSEDIVITFKIPTTGTVNENTINSSKLGGIKIYGYQFDNAGSVSFSGFSEEPTYQAETTTTTSEFTVDAEHGWRTVLNGLPLSKSNPVTSYAYTVEEISVNGTAVAESPFTVTYNNHEDIIGGTVTVTNTKQETDLTVSVTKKWYSLQSGGVGVASWPAGVSSVKVKIQKKNADGTVANLTTPEFYTNVSDTWSDTLELTSASQTQTWHHLDELQDGEAYVVTETFVVYNGTEIPVTDGIVTVNGVTYDVSCGPVASGSATVVNAARTNMNVTKTWDVPEGETISFEKPENAEVGSSYLSGSTVTVPKSALMIGVRLHRRMYQGGTEISGSDFDLTNADEAKYGETKLLYSAANASAAGRYANIFTDGANWSGEWQNLPTAGIDASGVVTTYAYSVEEVLVTVPVDYMHDGSNGLVNIVDQFQVTTNTSTAGTTAITNKLGSSYHLDVIKVWKDSSDNIVEGDPIEFKLLRNNGTGSGDPSGNDVTVYITTGSNAGDGEYRRFTIPSGSRITLNVSSYTIQRSGYTESARLQTYKWSNNNNYWHWDEVSECGTPSQMVLDVPNTNYCIHIKADNPISVETMDTMISYSIQRPNTSSGTAIKPNPSGAGYVADETATFTLNSDNNWTMQFRDLPMTGVEDGNTVNYTYSVQEVSPSGTDSHGNAFTTTYSGNPYDPAPETAGGDPRNGTITITNKFTDVAVNPAELNILKLKENNSGNEPAEGIQFTLKDSSDNTVTSGTTAADGTLTLTIPRNVLGAMTGTKTFTLYEDNPPENYVSDSPWTVTVTGTQSGTIYNWTVTSVTTESGNVSLNQDNNLYYTILNRRTSGSVTVEKVFSGMTALPENFGINASWTPAEGTTVTVDLKATGDPAYTLPEGVTSLPDGVSIERTGNGADATPYRWTISGLPVGTVVTFAEHDYQVNGYIVSATMTNDGQATAAVTPGEVTITNTYTPGVELPSTGGSGTALYTVLGLMLTLLAGSLLILRKRTAKGHR